MSFDRRSLGRKVAQVVSRLERLLGCPSPSIRRVPPLDMLVATVLSQNTNDRNSHQAYLRLREKYPTWENVLKAPARGIVSAIRVGGMAHQKSTRIKSMLAEISERFGKLDLRSLRRKPDSEVFEILVALDGVGSKTAACVLLFALGRDVFPVDTHIHRILGRLGLAPGCKSPERTYDLMKNLVPRGKAYALHINLIQFGRKICRAINPLCGMCTLYGLCRFEGKRERRGRPSTITPGRSYGFMLLDHV